MINAGIDIGTSFSSVTILQSGIAKPVRVKTGDSIFGDDFSVPTVVYADTDGEIKIGQLAYNKKARDPGRFKKDFKRTFGMSTPFLLAGEKYLAEDLYVNFFRHFKHKAEETAGDTVDTVFITHPAVYGEGKKRLLKRAANNAGFMKAELIDEPTAAAIAYSQKESVRTNERLLIYDLGGGTFDVSIICKTENGFVHLTEPLGISECGGIDFDRKISEDMMSALKQQGADANALLQNQRFTVKLSELCTKVKHALTYEDTITESVDAFTDYYEYTLTRERFNGLIAPYIDATTDKVSAIIKNAGISDGDISHVVLVGGSTQIPLVRKSLTERFGGRVSLDIDPILAVATGAVLSDKTKPEIKPKIKPCAVNAEPQKPAEECRFFVEKDGLYMEKPGGTRECLLVQKDISNMRVNNGKIFFSIPSNTGSGGECYICKHDPVTKKTEKVLFGAGMTNNTLMTGKYWYVFNWWDVLIKIDCSDLYSQKIVYKESSYQFQKPVTAREKDGWIYFTVEKYKGFFKPCLIDTKKYRIRIADDKLELL